MQQRGLFWRDVQTVVDNPNQIHAAGIDRYNRPKWIVRGKASDRGEIEIVCVIELDETETEFITIYWEN
jgi:hypothetical protein